MDRWLEWFAGNEALIVGVTAASVVTFVATLILVPFLLAKMPADYLVGSRPPVSALDRLPPGGRLLARIGKNLLGLVLLVMGFIMLFIPGQGVLTMVLGIGLLDFPGKRRLQQWIAARPRVRRSIDWIRRRRGQPPLRFEAEVTNPSSSRSS